MHSLADVLSRYISRSDTNYKPAIPALIRVAYCLFKLSQGCSFLMCSEMFAIGTNTISSILHDVVCAINIVLHYEISWPRGERLQDIQDAFHRLCGMSALSGVIDVTHVSMA